jgi:hypothetical protein
MAVPYSAPHLQIISNAAAQFMGKTGAPVIYNGVGSGPSPGQYCGIFFLADTVFSEMKFRENGGSDGIDVYVNNANAGDPISAITFKANSWLFANIYDFVLTSGTLILYKA